MRIVHVVALVDPAYEYGGPLTVAVQHVLALRETGHDAVLAGGWWGEGPPPAVFEGVPARLFRVVDAVPPLRRSGWVSPGLLRWLWRSAREVDVVHVHLGRELIPLLAAQVARVRGVPYVVMPHGMVVPDARRSVRVIDGLLTRRVLRGACTRFVLSPTEDLAVAAVAGDDRDQVLLPQAVAVPPADGSGPQPDHPAAPGAPPEVLFLARLHPRKRVGDFLAAAARLLRAGSPATFAVAGPDDGDLPRLQAFLAGNPDVADRITHLGPLDHDVAVRRLQTAALFVLPSADEPMPMTVLEAGVRGTPSVCTASCGLAAAITAAGAGVVVPDGDVDALVAAIAGLLDDPARLAAAGTHARELVLRGHGGAAVATRLVERYAVAVADGGRSGAPGDRRGHRIEGRR